MKLGLLISDDPDDYQTFFEAIDETVKDIILISMGSNQKAITYLEKFPTEYIIIDLSMNDPESAAIFKQLCSNPTLKNIPKLALVDDNPLIEMDSQAVFIHKSCDYAELKVRLSRFLLQ
jgi:hypothetical protein